MKISYKFKHVFIITISVIVVLLLIIILFHKLFHSDDQFIFSPFPQSVTERHWINIVIDSTKTLREFNGNILFQPFNIRLDNNGDVYFLDAARSSLIRLNNDRREYTQIGKGKGEGPGEFRHPIDYSITINDFIVICDAQNLTLTSFNKNNGEVISFTRLSDIPFRVESFGLNRHLVVHPPRRKELFHIYDSEGTIIKSFGFYHEDQLRYGVPINTIITSDEKAIYSTFMEAGYLISYSENGLNNYHRYTIDGTSFPELLVNGSRVRFSPDAPYVNLDIDIVGDHVVILSAIESIKYEGEVVFDIYKKDNGNYISSFRLHYPTEVLNIISFSMTNNSIYTIELLETGDYVIRSYYYTLFE